MALICKASNLGVKVAEYCKRRGSTHSSIHPVSFLELMFRPRKPNNNTDAARSGVENSRYGGTYAVPEARLESGKVSASGLKLVQGRHLRSINLW